MLTQQVGLWGGQRLADMGEGGQPASDGGWAPGGLLLMVQAGPKEVQKLQVQKVT